MDDSVHIRYYYISIDSIITCCFCWMLMHDVCEFTDSRPTEEFDEIKLKSGSRKQQSKTLDSYVQKEVKPETPADICLTKPCMNDGVCIRDTSKSLGFSCRCTEQFSGPVCENSKSTYDTYWHRLILRMFSQINVNEIELLVLMKWSRHVNGTDDYWTNLL